jgi:hypothetical protein
MLFKNFRADDDIQKEYFVAGEEQDAEDDLPRHDKVPNLKLVMNPEGNFLSSP